MADLASSRKFPKTAPLSREFAAVAFLDEFLPPAIATEISPTSLPAGLGLRRPPASPLPSGPPALR